MIKDCFQLSQKSNTFLTFILQNCESKNNIHLYKWAFRVGLLVLKSRKFGSFSKQIVSCHCYNPIRSETELLPGTR